MAAAAAAAAGGGAKTTAEVDGAPLHLSSRATPKFDRHSVLRDRRILCLVDGSPGAELAVLHALDLVRPSTDRLMLLHVSGVGADADAGRRALARAASVVRDYYDADDSVEVHFDVRHVINAKSVKGEVLKQARDFCASYVVVGARGVGELAQVTLGSMSAFLAHHCPCPVLVVRDVNHNADDVGLIRKQLGERMDDAWRKAEAKIDELVARIKQVNVQNPNA